MDGKQTAKKRRSPAFLVALVAAVLFCIGQPPTISAQPFPQVAPNGVGDLLIYHYWFTGNPQNPDDTRDTLIAIMHPFGGQPERFVHIKVHEGVGSQDVRDFTICLSPGDVWTAAITPGATATSSTLTVGNVGSCDASVSGAGFTSPPLANQPVPIGAIFGYIEAYTMEGNQLFGGGDDTIMGVASPVSVSLGFSSSYNAVAIVGFDAFNETASILNPQPAGGGGGLGTVGGVGGRTTVSRALSREGGVDKEILLARWTANPVISSITQLVLTFPGGFQPGSEPLSLWVFDENENFNFSPRTIYLPREVNTCTLETNPTTGNTQVDCAGSPNAPFDILGTGGTFTAGWLRILNNAVGIDFDSLESPPITRFPVIGLVFAIFFGDGSNIFDQSYPIQWASITGAGGIGGLPCRLGINCQSYSVESQFAPWYQPPANSILDLIVPGDNVTAGLNRTGTCTTADACP